MCLKGGYLYGIWQISDGSKKIRRFLKKARHLFKKEQGLFFIWPVVFGGAGFICTCRSIRMYVPQIPALYYMIFFLHSAFYFHFFYCIFAKKECNLNSMRILFLLWYCLQFRRSTACVGWNSQGFVRKTWSHDTDHGYLYGLVDVRICRKYRAVWFFLLFRLLFHRAFVM